MKLNVTEGDSSWTLSTPRYCGVGSNQNALPGLSNDFKPSALPVGGAKGGGTSRKNTSRGGYLYNFTYRHDDEGGADPVEDPCKIEYPKWEALPKALAYVLPLSLERKLPPTPLRISPMLESGQTKILCVSTISPDLPQFNFEVLLGSLSTIEFWVVIATKRVRGCTVCCVLDGHGPFGHEICHVVQQDLLRLTTDNPDLPVRSRSVLQEAFLKAHSNLKAKCDAFQLDSKLSGTTVTLLVYLREQNKLFIAHVGNSRAVLCKFNRYGCGVRAVDLTVDHTPTNNKEFRRIVKAEYKIDGKRDKFLLLCTDGVWNVISSQEAVEIANTAKQKEWRTAPEELARESWRRWINEEQIFADDMTALFLKLS
ncbi:protein phosphatase 2C, putative [Eimeria acervulina]|uniref:Protein phosphatase 2C, putative n=1 Tax=Eimeria acervulina TaxID=5801 RepID=U6GG58_EIMAC|nr:protein phosphatase 2C, putative [Eimeria acervulina]CDI79160.1 protein phosphatase 2C, putative [Eimeria acervulina]